MLPSGPPTPMGGVQSVSPSLLRSNSGMLTAQGTPFMPLVSPRTQYDNINLLGNLPNVSLLSQSFGNGFQNSGDESGHLSSIGNGLSYNIANPGSSNHAQGQQLPSSSENQVMSDQQLLQQFESQNFQHSQQSMQQYSSPQTIQQQQHYQSIRGTSSGVGQVKMEPQVINNDQHGQPQMHALRNFGQVKLEPQQMQHIRALGPMKMEPLHSDQSLFMQQQNQQQQFLHMSRHSSQAAVAQMNQLLHQQKLMQMQHQQQQFLKAIPQQRGQLQQFQQPNLPLRPSSKPVFEPGTCARRVTHYMYQQQRRPQDNNIDFWRKFVTEFFSPNAKKKWCVSTYGSGRQTTGVFPQDVWHCEICNRKPGRGFKATTEVLPRLFKIKYESGTLDELLYVDMPHEYQHPSGQIILDYAKAIQVSVFEQLRVAREGQLRIMFTPNLKISSWEFCAWHHEELIPRRLLISQVSQLGIAAQKYQAATQNSSSNLSVPELQNNCSMFVESARQLAKSLEVPLVNDLGYTKRYVRCLQISEVVNSMKDLIDYSRDTRTGPMETLAKFPRTSTSFSFHNQPGEHQQTATQNSNADQNTAQGTTQLTLFNGMSVNNSLNTASPSAISISGLHQNSINGRHTSITTNPNGPYNGNSAQIQSPISSNILPQTQTNQTSPFQSPKPSSSHMSASNSQVNISGDVNLIDTQSSVQKIIQEMMMSTQMNGVGSYAKNVNGIISTTGNFLAENGNGTGNANSSMGVGFGQPVIMNGMRDSRGNNNNSARMDGRVGMSSLAHDQSMNHQQLELGNQFLGGSGLVNGFNTLQFDWKTSP